MDQTDCNSQSAHPVARAVTDYGGVYAMTKALASYNAAYTIFREYPRAQRKPFIVLAGSKYMHDLKMIKNLVTIPWASFSHQIAYNISLPGPLVEPALTALRGIPTAHNTERLYTNVQSQAQASFTP